MPYWVPRWLRAPGCAYRDDGAERPADPRGRKVDPPIPARSTIVDVARLAEVAVGTASDALNGKGRVSENTRARVLAAAQTLRFVPHRAARGLPRARTMSIGLRFGHERVVPAGHFFVDVLAGAVEAASRSGYALSISSSALSTEGLVDGLIVVDPLTVADARDPSLDEHVPVVSIGRVAPQESAGSVPIPWVDVDHQSAAATLLDHLAHDAQEGPVWMLSLPGRYPFIRDLESAFTRWATTQGRDMRMLHVPDDPGPAADSIRAELESGHPAPALLLTALDRQAVGAQVALRDHPALIGCASDSDLLDVLEPPIAALALDGRAHGSCAVEMILSWLEDGSPPPPSQLPVRLIARAKGSVG
jgi:DNA-binding LacI/PurR family transcriptional regulator